MYPGIIAIVDNAKFVASQEYHFGISSDERPPGD